VHLFKCLTVLQKIINWTEEGKRKGEGKESEEGMYNPNEIWKMAVAEMP
jgi:hypothetical protein